MTTKKREQCPDCDGKNCLQRYDDDRIPHTFCFRCGEWQALDSDDAKPASNAAFVKQLEERNQRYQEVAKRLTTRFHRAKPAVKHPYLERKQVNAYGLRMEGDLLLIPGRDLKGNIWTLQTVNASGVKRFVVDSRKAGSFHAIGDLGADVLLLCEGYATGATIHAATQRTVIVCFDAGNLLHVAGDLRAMNPDKRIVICADNDQFDKQGNMRSPAENIGVVKATRAAKEIGASLVIPQFNELTLLPTDFNDMATIEGLNVVKEQIEAEINSSATQQSNSLVVYDKNNNPSLIAHNKAASLLHREEFKSLLYYDSIALEWYQYDKSGLFVVKPDLVIQQAVYHAVNRHCDDIGFSHSYVSGVTKCLLYESIKQISPHKHLICFKNGVLEIKTRKLLPHSSNYFFTSQLPFDWNPNASEPKPVIDWLTETVGGKEDQVRLLRAWLQAVIVGRSDLQRFLELIGAGGSGKGSFVRLCIALVGQEAAHSTMLKQLEDSRFETAKLFNKKLVVINDAEKWHGDVSVLKSITGQDHIRFEEKNKQANNSFTFDGMVMIAANQHTTSNDYSSGIQRRRITVAFDHVVSPDKRRDLEAEFQPHLSGVVKWVLDMPEQEVTDLLRSTSKHVKSLENMRMETLAATNPVIGWLLDNVHFDPDASAQVGTKKRVNVTDGEGACKVSRYEYEGRQTLLYPNYCAWCDENGKKQVSLNMFARTIVDCSRNLLGKKFVKSMKDAETRRSIIQGLSCENYEGLTKGYPKNQVIEKKELKDSKDSKEFSNNQIDDDPFPADSIPASNPGNFGAYGGSPSRPSVPSNQGVSPSGSPSVVLQGAQSRRTQCQWGGYPGKWIMKCSNPNYDNDGCLSCGAAKVLV